MSINIVGGNVVACMTVAIAPATHTASAQEPSGAVKLLATELGWGSFTAEIPIQSRLRPYVGTRAAAVHD